MADNIKHYDRQAPRDRALRASDRDRDAVGDILRRQHLAGRLDTDEFADRYGRCLQARTYSDLDELIADLPVEAEPAFAGGPAPVPGGARGGRAWWEGAWHRGPGQAGGRPWRVPALAWLAVVLAIALVSGGRLVWVAFPLFFFVARPLMWRSARHGGPRGSGPWGCRSGFAGPGTTTV